MLCNICYTIYNKYNKYNQYLLYMHWLTIYKKSNLPLEGWIQQCFICYNPTSHTIDYQKDTYTHTVYLCKCCQKKNKLTENNKQYIKCVEEYIKTHTPQPFEVPSIPLSPPKIVSRRSPLNLPRPHTIRIPLKKIEPAPESEAAPPEPAPEAAAPAASPEPAAPEPAPEPAASLPRQKSIYENLFDMASKKLSTFARKITTAAVSSHNPTVGFYIPVEPNPPPPL